MVVREVLDNGLRLITETMPHVRSVTIGVWLMRGSRHESDERGGIAHFVEHMLFKGTDTRTAEDIAQAIDSIGGQLDAFTAKEYASYYIKVLDEHLPLAVDLLSDIVLRPAFARRRDRAREEGDPRRDQDGRGHAGRSRPRAVHAALLGRAPARAPDSRARRRPSSRSRATSLLDYFRGAYVAPNMIISAAGNLEHAQRARAGRGARSARCASDGEPLDGAAPRVVPQVITRTKELEQSHICLGTNSYPQNHDDRYVSYILNTVLGGSMSSRLFQNVREKRGLAYAVFSGLSAYRDAGNITIYAGCSNEAVGEVIDLCVEELRGMKRAPVPTRSCGAPRIISRAA